MTASAGHGGLRPMPIQPPLRFRPSKLGIDATKKLPGEGFKRPWPPLIKMDAAVKARVDEMFK
jgi:3-polyprenyl-4-hydroxybenzoate decarboxylase